MPRALDDSDQFKIKGRLLMVEAGRVAFLVAVLLITFYFQLRQPDFLGHDLLVPLYACVFCSFLVHTVYIWNFDRFSRLNLPTIFLFVFEAFFISALIFFTGITQSIFIFLYLVNIIFCGFIYRRQGALFLALLTSILYSTLLIFKPDISGEIVFFSLALNNLGFFSVALLSGYLSEQLGVLGLELIASHRNIQELKDLNKLIIDNVTSGLVTLDSTGRIVLANRAAEAILDESSNLYGRIIFHVLPGLKKFESRFSEEAGRIDRFEIDYVNSSDEKLLLGFSVSPLIHQGQFAGNVLIFQDLTKIKRLERAMQMSEKMAAVGQLAAGIAHEIRNPLAGISGSLQLLRATSHGDGSEEYRLMSIALKEIDRLNRLITDFLDFVRPSQPAHDIVDLKSLITEVVDLVKVKIQFEKKSEVNFHTEFNAIRSVAGHRDQLKQVFYNLIINATHAVEGVSNPSVHVRTEFQNGAVVVIVRDNGCGMNTQTQKRIFEPFFTTKAKGTGLGLATVHKIVENHEAKIFVESELNKGTEFVIEFPLLDTTESKKRA